MKKTVFSQFTLITSVVFLLLVTACSSPSGSSSSPKTNSEPSANTNTETDSKPVEPKKLDAVCCSNDSTAMGVTSALLEADFTASNFPVITGQDCDIEAVRNMIAGTQSMSVFKYTGDLSAKVVEMAEAAFKDNPVDINDTRSYNNDRKIVPTYKVSPVVVTRNNYRTYLINTNYYTEDANGNITYPSSSGSSGTISTTPPNQIDIGIVMPYPLQRWREDGENIKTGLSANHDGKIYLTFANPEGASNEYEAQITSQITAIETMIADNNCKVIIIAPVNGYSLTTVLNEAKSKNITIISYDRLIMDSDAVTYYATFDNYKVGTLQGQFIVDNLNLASRTSSNPANIEFFTGDIRDNNINFFFGGAMDILKPYLDSGVLVCPSGQTTKQKAATEDWLTSNAKRRMKTLISSCKYSPDL